MSAAERAEQSSLLCCRIIKKDLFSFFSFHLQETDELYIVSQFFVEEWRKFVR